MLKKPFANEFEFVSEPSAEYKEEQKFARFARNQLITAQHNFCAKVCLALTTGNGLEDGEKLLV